MRTSNQFKYWLICFGIVVLGSLLSVTLNKTLEWDKDVVLKFVYAMSMFVFADDLGQLKDRVENRRKRNSHG